MSLAALVTPTNPAREDGTLDHIRCSTLYNYLVQFAWTGDSRDLSDLDYEAVSLAEPRDVLIKIAIAPNKIAP